MGNVIYNILYFLQFKVNIMTRQDYTAVDDVFMVSEHQRNQSFSTCGLPFSSF